MSLPTQVVGLDNGYWGYKAVCGNEYRYMLTRIEKGVEKGAGRKDRHAVEFEGESYIVGVGAQVPPINIDKTFDKNHLILSLVMLSKFMGANAMMDFNVVGGLPIGLHNEDKAAFAKYLKGDGSVRRIRIDGQDKFISISRIAMFPQGYAAAFGYGANNFEGKRVYLLDFGGYSIDGLMLEDMNEVPASEVFSNYGMHKVFENVAVALTPKLRMNVTPQMVEDYFNQDETIFDKSVRAECNDIMDKELNEMMKELKHKCGLKNWELSMLVDGPPVIITGGAAAYPRVRKHIAMNFRNVFMGTGSIEDLLYANAKGFYILGKAKFK